MRESMDAIRRYAEIEAVKDFKAQYMSEVNWQQLKDTIELQSAPKREYDREQDMAQVDRESARLREEIGSLQSDLQKSSDKAEELERTIQDLQHQSEMEKSRREKAERDLDAFKLSAGSQEAKNREDASRKAEQAARKQSELESKATRLQSDLDAVRRDAESEKRQYDHDLQTQKTRFDSDLETSRRELAEARAEHATVTAGSETQRAFAHADLQIAGDNLARAQETLRREGEAHQRSSGESLQREKERRSVVELDLQTARSDLSERGQSLLSANNGLDKLNKEVEQLTASRNQARSSLLDTKAKLEARVSNQESLEKAARSAKDERDAAESTLRSEKADHEVTKSLLAQARERESNRSRSDKAAIEGLQSELATERSEHARTKSERDAEVDSLNEQLRELRTALSKSNKHHEETKVSDESRIGHLKKAAEDQLQAVFAFAKYCLGVSSSVIAPSVGQMQTLQSQCYESQFSEGIPGLPAIVIVGGQIPAKMSYLSFASAGVSIDSRFNQKIISPAIFSELPWINDTLARVIDATLHEIMTADLRRTLMVLLQGIAYVHNAAPLWTKTPLEPEPSTLLASLVHIERGDGSVLGMVHQQVYDLVHHGTRFTSWVREGFTGELLSSTNSALPQDVALIHLDTPGTVFMAHSSVGLFIIDEHALNVKLGWAFAKLQMPPGTPEDLRHMDLASDEHVEVLTWATSIYGR